MFGNLADNLLTYCRWSLSVSSF